MGQTLSKNRRNKGAHESRKADIRNTPKSYCWFQNIDYNNSEFEEIIKVLLPLSIEAIALEAKLEESKAFYAWWKTKDAKNNL